MTLIRCERLSGSKALHVVSAPSSAFNLAIVNRTTEDLGLFFFEALVLVLFSFFLLETGTLSQPRHVARVTVREASLGDRFGSRKKSAEFVLPHGFIGRTTLVETTHSLS